MKKILILIMVLMVGCSQKINILPHSDKEAIPLDPATVRELSSSDITITPTASNATEIVKNSGVVDLSFSVKNNSTSVGKIKLTSNSKFLFFNIVPNLTSCGIDVYKTLNPQQSCLVTVLFNSSSKDVGFYSSTFDATDKYNGVIKSQDISILETDSIAMNNPSLSACKPGYHMDSRTCVSNRQTCSDIGFSAGEKFWNITTKSFGSCLAIQCLNNYKLYGSAGSMTCSTCSDPSTHFLDLTITSNLCVSNTNVSSILNGSCTQQWQGSMTAGDFGSCQISCVSDQFQSDGVQCLRTNYAFATSVQNQAIGRNHSCFISSDNKLRCSGDNSFGQLGLGFTGGSQSVLATNQYVDFSSFGVGLYPIDVTVTDTSSCAILSDNSVKCWGRNNYGQLGNGTRIDSSIPVSVLLSTNSASMIRSSMSMVCAKLTTSGQLSCWGRLVPLASALASSTIFKDPGSINYSYTSSNISTTETNYVFFTPVTSLGNPLPELIKKENGENFVVNTFSMGGSHLCLIESVSSNIFCHGALLTATLEGVATAATSMFYNRYGFMSMPAGVTAMGLASGNQNTCIAGSDNNIYCIGYTANGVTLNNGSPFSTPSSAASTGASCSSGSTSTCGQLTSNYITYQGLGMTLNNIGIGKNHACATFTDALNPSISILKCWGSNNSYQLADQLGDKNYAGIPISWGDSYSVKSVAFGGTTGDSSCVVMNDSSSTVKCFGASNYGEIPLKTLNSKQSFPDAIMTTSSRVKFIPLTPTYGQTIVGVGGYDLCAIDSIDNQIKCVGISSQATNDPFYLAKTRSVNAVGSFYANDFSNSNKIDLGTGVTATQIAALYYQRTLCAITNEATSNIKCIGSPYNGVLGNGQSTVSALAVTTPIGITGLTFKFLTNSDSAFCAITTTGSVYCWGYVFGTIYLQPTLATGVTNAINVMIAAAEFCYADSLLNLKCAGQNNGGYTNLIAVTTTATTGLATMTFSTLASADVKGFSGASNNGYGVNGYLTTNGFKNKIALSTVAPSLFGGATTTILPELNGTVSVDNVHPNYTVAQDDGLYITFCMLVNKNSTYNSNIICNTPNTNTVLTSISGLSNGTAISINLGVLIQDSSSSGSNVGYVNQLNYLPNLTAKAIFRIADRTFCVIQRDDSSLTCITAATSNSGISNMPLGTNVLKANIKMPTYYTSPNSTSGAYINYIPMFESN
jgi:hypothetical protein